MFQPYSYLFSPMIQQARVLAKRSRRCWIQPIVTVAWEEVQGRPSTDLRVALRCRNGTITWMKTRAAIPPQGLLGGSAALCC